MRYEIPSILSESYNLYNLLDCIELSVSRTHQNELLSKKLEAIILFKIINRLSDSNLLNYSRPHITPSAADQSLIAHSCLHTIVQCIKDLSLNSQYYNYSSALNIVSNETCTGSYTFTQSTSRIEFVYWFAENALAVICCLNTQSLNEHAVNNINDQYNILLDLI